MGRNGYDRRDSRDCRDSYRSECVRTDHVSKFQIVFRCLISMIPPSRSILRSGASREYLRSMWDLLVRFRIEWVRFEKRVGAYAGCEGSVHTWADL